MADNVTLYDHLNRPIRRQELTREHAAPSVTGVRTVWDDTVAAGLTPMRLAGLLRAAAQGETHEYLTLAEEMEERDLHYACELGKRKLAVSRLPITVEAATDDKRDQDLAEAVRLLTRRPGFRALLKDLLDGLGKGYSAVEIIWDRAPAAWRPGRYDHRDPRFFQLDRIARRELRLRDEDDLMDGLPLAPYKWIVHVPHLKTGLPIRGGLARLAAWAWMCKNYSIKDWMAFAEVFGMPLRIGKYGAGANDDDIGVLKMAVANLGSDAAAVIPESMKIDLVERSASGGAVTVYQVLADWFDTQVSRGVLGQSATTSGTPGKLGADEAQSRVRDDIRDDDAEQLAETLNRDLVRPFIDLNFGPQENYPQLVLRDRDREDVVAISDSLAKLVPLGLEIEQSVVRDRLGWPDPDPKAKPEDLLRPPAVADPFGGLNRSAPGAGCGCGAGRSMALNRETAAAEIEELAAEELADWRPVMEPLIDPIRRAVEQAASLEELRAGLAELLAQQDPAALTEALAEAMFKARALGDTDGD